MTEIQMKSKQTRENTRKTRAELFEEETEAVRLVKVALERVLHSEDATTAQLLKAAELVSGMVHSRRW